MALLEKTDIVSDEEIMESGYYQVFGNIELAKIFREAQSACIRNGNELENIIYDNIPYKKFKNIDIQDAINIIDENKDDRIYFDKIIIKDIFYKKYGINLSGKKQYFLDCLFYNRGKIYVVEYKDGASLDTKKSEKEVQGLYEIFMILTMIGYTDVDFGLVLWRCSDLKYSSIKTDRKDFTKRTGKEFSEILGINFDEIARIKQIDQERNIQRVKEIFYNIFPVN